MLPVEAFDTRGYIGTLTFYPTCPATPALHLVTPTNAAGFVLSTNLEEHGWYANGRLRIAVKQYEPSYVKAAESLVALGVLRATGETKEGPHGPGWTMYDLVEHELKSAAVLAWTAHTADLTAEAQAEAEPRGDAPDHSPENLRRLTQKHLRRYEDRRSWGNANHAELSRLIAVWLSVEAENYAYDNLSDEAKVEIRGALQDGE